MDVLTEDEIDRIVHRSSLVAKYDEVVDRESASEILQRKMDYVREAEVQETRREELEKATKQSSRTQRGERSFVEDILRSPTTKQIAGTLTRELTRGLLSVLGIGGRRRR
jgi:hypothetical protein